MQDADTSVASPSETFNDAFSAPEPAQRGGNDGEKKGPDEGQPRDDHGRFAEKPEGETAGTEVKGPEERQPDATSDGGQIPSWRLREIREERDKIAFERDNDRRELERLRQERAEFQRQQRQVREAQEAPQRPDPIADPDGYADYVERTMGNRAKSIEEQFRDRWVNLTFADQHEQHGEAFEKAMQALEKARSPQVVADIQNAINPGKALMKWYRRNAAMTEIGDDLDGYKKRLRDEFKKDPEFRKEFMADLDAEARGDSGRRSSNNVTDIPSVNRAPGAARAASAADADVFEAAFGGRKRGG